MIETWVQDGDHLVGIKSGTRIRMDRVGAGHPRLMRRDEIAPGVPWLERYEPSTDFADGVYEQMAAKFRRLGKDVKHPREISRWTQFKAGLWIRWHRRPESRLTRWHRDRMRDKYG